MIMDGFTTVSGSVYEVDLERHLIRRTCNTAGRPPTQRLGQDGTWKPFHRLRGSVVIGEDRPSIMIVWDRDGAATLTSALVAVTPGMAQYLSADRAVPNRWPPRPE